MEIKVKTDKELLIELRNQIAGNLVKFKANILYWQEVSRKAKKISQEKAEAISNIATNEQNAKKDRLFLKCIESLIK